MPAIGAPAAYKRMRCGFKEEFGKVAYYNNERTHQGKMCCGRTPMQTLIDGKEAWRDKIITLND